MNKEEVVTSLESIEGDVRKLETLLKTIKSTTLSRVDIMNLAKRISRMWFEDLEKIVTGFDVPDAVVTKYHLLFDKLLLLSLKTSWRDTYKKTTRAILEDFRVELIAPVLKSSGPVLGFEHLSRILDTIADNAEKDYLSEAVNCAIHGYLRASSVLGWNAAVHRMHRKVEKLGFADFNKKSEEMKKITEGRFKRFNKSFSIHSASELRATVFDTDLLWVIEYWGLIDANQHERLQTCFTMRSNCAHPGEAPMSPENLASFYSDLKNMVFDNPKFKL